MIDDTLDLRTFEAEYEKLLRARPASGGNDKCVELIDCSGCSLSTFCRKSTQLTRSHYCSSCERCSDCSHCEGSKSLLGCHHCAECTECIGSSYLVRCSSMTKCHYCFGCVGLSNQDFHILNQPYDRSTYFRITRRLQSQFSR